LALEPISWPPYFIANGEPTCGAKCDTPEVLCSSDPPRYMTEAK
jgi:hypothetical protein